MRFATALASVLLFGSVSTASAENVPDLGDWSLKVNSQTNSPLSQLCILRSPDQSGTFIQITNGPLRVKPSVHGNGILTIYFPDSVKGINTDTSQVTISLKPGKTWTNIDAKVSVLENETKAVVMTLDPEVQKIIKPFSVARSVSLRLDDAVVAEVELRGSLKALKPFQDCVKAATVSN